MALETAGTKHIYQALEEAEMTPVAQMPHFLRRTVGLMSDDNGPGWYYQPGGQLGQWRFLGRGVEDAVNYIREQHRESLEREAIYLRD